MTGTLTGMMCEDTEKHTEKISQEHGGREWNSETKPRITKDCQQPPAAGKGKEGFFLLQSFQQRVALQIPGFQASGLQKNYKRINFCSVKPPSSGNL